MSSGRFVVGCFVVAMAWPTRADTLLASQHFARAVAAEREGNDELALAEYREAFAQAPAKRPLLQIAALHERHDRPRDAGTALRAAIDLDPAAPDVPALGARIAALRARPSKLAIATDVTATAIVDGTPVGQTPITVEVTGGEHRITAEIAGERAPETVVTPEYGEPASASIALSATLFVRVDGDGALTVDGAPWPRRRAQAIAPGKHVVAFGATRREVVVRIGAAASVGIDPPPPVAATPEPPPAHPVGAELAIASPGSSTGAALVVRGTYEVIRGLEVAVLVDARDLRATEKVALSELGGGVALRLARTLLADVDGFIGVTGLYHATSAAAGFVELGARFSVIHGAAFLGRCHLALALGRFEQTSEGLFLIGCGAVTR